MTHTKPTPQSERRNLREQMRAAGLSHRDIATELARRYNYRPRTAWRQAHGWSLRDAADRINSHTGQTGIDSTGIAGMTGAHLCEYETWPGYGAQPTGRRPTPYLLSLLAAVYGCDVTELIDLADRQHLKPAHLLVLERTTPTPHPQPEAPPPPPPATPAPTLSLTAVIPPGCHHIAIHLTTTPPP